MTPPVAASFDALVIGAGPAGSATALRLARAGWSVALVERQRFPRRKVCGECLAASNLPLLQALGVGAAVDAQAGPPLRRVALLAGDAAAGAALPAANDGPGAWGRALGREVLDPLLLEQALRAGAVLWQPWHLRAITGEPGRWTCELRPRDAGPPVVLGASVLVAANGSWEAPPAGLGRRRHLRGAADLFAFKANFTGTRHPEGQISVLALDGGYGGMVVADRGTATLACCIRRDRMTALRQRMPGAGAGDVVEDFLRRSSGGVRQALDGATREGPWLTAGPLDIGVRLDARDGIFRVGNAAGEAHPILGEGMSMALQSAMLLCDRLLAATPDAAGQADAQRLYAAAWHRQFDGRRHLAAVFAHLAMRPAGAALLLAAARAWPGLLTQGARWGGKVRPLPPALLEEHLP